MPSFSVPMKVLEDTVSKGAVNPRSGCPLTPEEIAIMIVCAKMNKFHPETIDSFIQLWMEGTIRITHSGSWPIGQLCVEIPESKL